MPVENPSIEYPNKAYINSLNPDWPSGSDFPSDGDDHIRGIKNVLKQTFPNLTGPVTLTQAEMNSGSKLLGPGTTCLFYQNNAPTGWTRVNPAVGNRMLIVTSGGAGEGGVDDPLFNNKVPYHNHAVVGGTDVQNADHQHYVELAGGDHQHVYRSARVQRNLYLSSGGGTFTIINATSVNDAYATEGGGTGNGGHLHGGWSQGINANHAHSISITSQPNASAANWSPRYTACIMARRD